MTKNAKENFLRQMFLISHWTNHLVQAFATTISSAFKPWMLWTFCKLWCSKTNMVKFQYFIFNDCPKQIGGSYKGPQLEASINNCPHFPGLRQKEEGEVTFTFGFLGFIFSACHLVKLFNFVVDKFVTDFIHDIQRLADLSEFWRVGKRIKCSLHDIHH